MLSKDAHGADSTLAQEQISPPPPQTPVRGHARVGTAIEESDAKLPGSIAEDLADSQSTSPETWTNDRASQQHTLTVEGLATHPVALPVAVFFFSLSESVRAGKKSRGVEISMCQLTHPKFSLGIRTFSVRSR